MKYRIGDDILNTYMVFADFDDCNDGYVYGVELHQNREVMNVEWFKTQEEQQTEYERLNAELSRGEW